MQIWLRFAFAAALAYGCAPRLIADEVPSSARDYAHLAKLFSPPDRPDFVDKPWVKIEYNRNGARSWKHGWLVSEADGILQIYTTLGHVERMRRPRPTDRRPQPLFSADQDEEEIYGTKPVDDTVAWEIAPQDYLAESRLSLIKGSPRPSFSGYRYPQYVRRSHAVGEILSAARHAYLAYAYDELPLADDWYDEMVQLYRDYEPQFHDPDGKLPLDQFLTLKQAEHLRSCAIFAAVEGDPREELLQIWQFVAALPEHPYWEEAEEMVLQYERLLAEDQAYREPTAAERAQFSTNRQIDDWLYQLRDWDTENLTDEGECRIFPLVRNSLRPRRFDLNRPNPALELKEIGAAALPKLIDQIVDRRPVRCQCRVDLNGEYQDHLLRYGDCCIQIFESIAAIRFEYPHVPGACPTVDQRERQIQAAARRWWSEHPPIATDGCE